MGGTLSDAGKRLGIRCVSWPHGGVLGPHYSSIILRGSRGALNWATIMPRYDSLSDSYNNTSTCLLFFFLQCGRIAILAVMSRNLVPVTAVTPYMYTRRIFYIFWYISIFWTRLPRNVFFVLGKKYLSYALSITLRMYKLTFISIKYN